MNRIARLSIDLSNLSSERKEGLLLNKAIFAGDNNDSGGRFVVIIVSYFGTQSILCHLLNEAMRCCDVPFHHHL